MRPLALAVALVAATATLPAAAADHVDTQRLRKGCGFSEEEWDEGRYDCGGSIPSIQDPGFVSAETGDEWLHEGDRVIGVEAGGEAKAYPIRILNYHEIANDEVDGTPIAVTYCPLCGSSIVFERTVEGQVLDLHVSGYLFKQDLVMVDEGTHSLWPQILGEAIRGELHGTTLALFASTTTTWGDWLEDHPDTRVLERPRCGDGSTDDPRGCRGEFQRNYNVHPYGNYDDSRRIGITSDERGDVLGLHPKDTVLGLELDGAAVAYPASVLSDEQLVHDTVADAPLVVTWARSTVNAFHNPDERAFELADGNETLVDGDGARYDAATGAALDGGEGLDRVEGAELFWFAWLDHHPETFVHTANGTQRVAGHEPPDPTPGPGLAGLAAALAAALAACAVTGRLRRT